MSAPKSKRSRGGASSAGGGTAAALVGATEMESGCIACGGSDHSHRTCVLVGAALHRWFLQLAPGKDMKEVLDIILGLLMWGWREARFGEEITCLSYTPGGDIISAGGTGGSIFFMSAQTGEKIVRPVTGHSRPVTSVAWNNDGTKLVSGSSDETVKIWSVGSAGTFECQSTLNAHSDWVRAVSWSPCGKWLASGGNDKMVYIYDAQTFEVKCPVRGHSEDNTECICELHACMDVCMRECTHVHMYACMSVCTYVCIYVCMHIRVD
jgi:WD40 repeat protein